MAFATHAAMALVLQPNVVQPTFVRASTPLMQAEEPSIVDKVSTAIGIYQAASAEGVGFKQAVADAIAGEYDRKAVTSEVQALAQSGPLVLFTWDSSPACKKALKLIELTGASPTLVKLDDPWDKGNVMRSAL